MTLTSANITDYEEIRSLAQGELQNPIYISGMSDRTRHLRSVPIHPKGLRLATKSLLGGARSPRRLDCIHKKPNVPSGLNTKRGDIVVTVRVGSREANR